MNHEIEAHGKYKIEQWRDGVKIREFEDSNAITNEGKNALLDIMFAGVTASDPWYIGLIDGENAQTLAVTDTYNVHAGWVENADYDEATRPEWTEGSAASQVITNAVSVDFTINDTCTLHGIFVSDSNVKEDSTSGSILWATGAFASEISAISGDVIKVTYSVSVT